MMRNLKFQEFVLDWEILIIFENKLVYLARDF